MDASPHIITYDPAEPPAEFSPTIGTFGWGLGWYPPHDKGTAVLKDPTRASNNQMKELLSQWERFRSTIFLGHLRGAAMRIAQEDTHPISRTYAGKEFLIVHNGQLSDDFREKLSIELYPEFQPVGMTDTEHILCWVLMRMRQDGFTSFKETGYVQLHAWLSEVDELGSLNLMLSDGQDLILHQDRNGFHPLYYIRKKPPHVKSFIETNELSVKLPLPQDQNCTALVFASKPSSIEAWTPMSLGQTMVCCKAQVIWDSHFGKPADVPKIVAPARVSKPVYRIFHETRYTYSTPVLRSQHLLRMSPMNDGRQTIIDWKLDCLPLGIQVDYDDVFGNRVRRIDYHEPFREMVTCLKTLVRVEQDVSEALHTPSRRSTIPLNWMPWQQQMMTSYLLPTEMPETQLQEIYDYARGFVSRNNGDLVETLLDINRTIYNDYDYVPGSTNIETTAYQVFCSRKGVCQDFANMMIVLARLLGVPARYRMGYIYTGADYVNKIQSEASHAWAECYLPRFGWCGFDPTNGCLANFDHIRVSSGRNFRDATPTSGTIYHGGGKESLSIIVKVERVE